jgi:hypothetical protein
MKRTARAIVCAWAPAKAPLPMLAMTRRRI